MSVAVIIVNYNSGALLTECLRHLEMQTVKPDLVLVVDNQCFDEAADRFEQLFDITLLKMTSNLGFAAGNNRALARCDTEFIALLNPDAFPEPDWLEQLLNSAKTSPDAAMFGSRQLCYESPVILDGIGDIYHMSGLVWRQRHGVRQQAEDLAPREIFSPCAAAVLYRRQALMDAGGFDEDYFCYVEDVDLGFRLRLAGHKAMYVPNAVVHHVGSATTGGHHGDFAIYHGHRNLVWTYVKNMPGVLFWLLLPLHLMLNLVTVMWFTIRGQGSVILRAKLDAIKGLPIAWLKRTQIQAARRAKVWDIWQVLDKRLFPIRGNK